MTAIRRFLQRVRSEGVRRHRIVEIAFMGRTREFLAFNVGEDTFIFERGISRHLSERPSVLIVAKSALQTRARGRVMTMTSGNHSVAAFPLLDGRFWKLSKVPPELRSEILTHAIVCANVVDDNLEISQRDIALDTLVATDRWLLKVAGFGPGEVVMGDRNEATLEHYRRQGLEWRIKPLAWTETEMRVALAASRKRIATTINYYHSTRGVHLLSFGEFRRFTELAKTDLAAFTSGLEELVGVYEGNAVAFARMPKYRGHNEVEFFGLHRGLAVERIVPELECLLAEIRAERIGQPEVIRKAGEIVALYESLLTRPELSDDASKVFVETIYMYVTGEIYYVVGEGLTPAFDDRRTALPGATFVEGRPEMHPGADSRTEILLSNLRGLMSKDEIVEYANVYELRADDDPEPVGKGATREVVYKSNRRPLENSLVEKRLSHSSRGYSGYTLARIGALRALGVALSDRYLLLKQRPGKTGSRTDYYIRSRCEGEPMSAIPANYFRHRADAAQEDESVVLGLASLMGEAAAQNLVMKKYDHRSETPLFGIGKEIYEFEYDLQHERRMPKRVSICSIRGSLGWPCLDYTDDNLAQIENFYFGHFVRALADYRREHAGIDAAKIAARFLDGFEFRIHALQWQLNLMRDRFEAFDPDVPARYGFANQWKFVMWSLDRHARDLPRLRQLLLEKINKVTT